MHVKYYLIRPFWATYRVKLESLIMYYFWLITSWPGTSRNVIHWSWNSFSCMVMHRITRLAYWEMFKLWKFRIISRIVLDSIITWPQSEVSAAPKIDLLLSEIVFLEENATFPTSHDDYLLLARSFGFLGQNLYF